MEISGIALAICGAAIAIACGGIGSAVGVGIAGQAGAGVASEKPESFGKILLLQALPGTQGIYGFLGAIMILSAIGLLGGEVKTLTVDTGWQFLFASIPVGIGGMFSGIFQGKVSAAGQGVVAKNPANVGKAVILSAMVETYAILGLLVSILLITGIKF